MNDDIASARKLLEKVRDVSNDVFLTATRGLLKLKEGDVGEGSRLYNLAATLASNVTLRRSVLQKKHLELARYYLQNNRQNDAKINLKNALIVKGRESIYAKQALELYKRYFRTALIN